MGYFPGPGPLNFYGRFAIDPTDGYLEQCGSGRRFLINGSGPVGNLTAVVWQSATDDTFEGRFLPTLRMFTMPAPVASIYAPQLALLVRHLYVFDDRGRVWDSLAPKLLRRRR